MNVLFWSVWAATCCAENPAEVSVAPAGDVGAVAELLPSDASEAAALAPLVQPERWFQESAADAHDDRWDLALRDGPKTPEDSRRPDEDLEFDEGWLGT